MIGWTVSIGTLGVVAAQSSIALLAGPFGGLPRVVGYLVFLILLSAVVFGWYVDETRGMSLEAAAKEAGTTPAG